MWKKHNENPVNNRVGDCVIRAISTALNQDWTTTFVGLCIESLVMFDLPSSNAVWGSYLAEKGYTRKAIPNNCKCYTVEDFCKDHPSGTYILAVDGHVVCVQGGYYYDSWDSGYEEPIYYWTK